MPYSLCELMIWRRLSTLQPEPPHHLPSRITTDKEPESDLTKQLDPTEHAHSKDQRCQRAGKECSRPGPAVDDPTEETPGL